MLKSLKLLPVYDSSEYDLIKGLIIPLLQNSNSYLRGVGFFTSGWIKLASQGLTQLIENGGKANIVLSPILQQSDWKAFQLGEEAKFNETLKKILKKNIDDISKALERDTLNALAWMIADDVLEYKFAVAREYPSGGDYHDKVGVFEDDQSNVVAIHGSFNDRQEILKQFANGDIQVIVAVKCLDEGVDVPSTRTAFFLASTSNPKEFVQRRGRILRLAKGKNKAILYDFIVVPRPEYVTQKRDVDASLLKREMPRFTEFASSATNEFEARSLLWDLLNRYEMLNLFDEKPWDIYHKLLEDKKDSDLFD